MSGQNQSSSSGHAKSIDNVYQGYRGYLMNPQTSPQERVRAHDEMSRIEQGNLKPNEYAPQSQGQGQGYGQGYGQKR